jgi:uncharacterized membrane protein YedE/YeeE
VSRAVQQSLAALGAGLLFGAGLVISGMTDPNKVIGFLDVLGHWDASLMLVMVGAIGVHAPVYRWLRGRTAPWLTDGFSIPPPRRIDSKLLFGALVFGVGWGLSGYCPGPSLVAVPSLRLGTLVFVSALMVGTVLTGKLEAALAQRKDHVAEPASTRSA